MKIKIVYDVDMRLWRHNLTEDKPSYQDLATYVTNTFEFDDIKQFRITFKDDEDDQITIASQQDFEDAFTFAKKSAKKSLKLYIVNTAESHYFEQKESKEEIIDNKESKPDYHKNNRCGGKWRGRHNNCYYDTPSEEEINAFISDDFAMDLLSDLFISAFEALQASNFEMSFIESVEGILSNNDKYIKLKSNKVWPCFMKTLLPNISNKIERFMIPMIKMHGINSEMIKQWIPTLLNMIKYHKNNGGFCGKWRRRRGHCRGGRGRHCRGWKRRHDGHHGHHGGHQHGYGHRHHGHCRGRGGFGYGYHQTQI